LEEVKRSAGYNLDLDNYEIAISDDRLEPGWYRIISAAGTEMPTEAPGTFRCKTWYPIWLDGIDNYSLYACIDFKQTSGLGGSWILLIYLQI
jgi:hypothetical protein